MSYYEEILEEIEEKIRQKKYEEALAAVNHELGMPYVPSDFEKSLRKYKKDLAFLMSEKEKPRELSADQLLGLLESGKPEAQLAAVSGLAKRDLREFVPEIQKWLEDKPYPEAAAYLVDAIAVQRIGDDFTWNKNGVEYDFFGDGLTPVAESGGVRKAVHLLQTWLENDYPDLYEMTKMVLSHEAYMFLPLSYDEEEGEALALEVVKQVSDMMDAGEVYQKVLKETGHSDPSVHLS